MSWFAWMGAPGTERIGSGNQVSDGRRRWRPGLAVSASLRGRIGALGALVAATLAALNPTLGLWWGFPLAVTSALALVWPYRGSLVSLAAAALLMAVTGLPAWGRQAAALSLSLAAAGLVAGFSALTGRVGVPSGPDDQAATTAIGSALARVSLVAGLGGLGTFVAVIAGRVMIVPWIEVALALSQTGLALAVGAALGGDGASGGTRRYMPLAFIVALVSFAPLVWMLFLAE